jgi:hypothetical protein
MRQKLNIGNLNLYYASEVELTTSRSDPVDVLKIKLPKNKGVTKEDIKLGMEVVWKAGYYQYSKDGIEEFKGKVVEVSPRVPLEIIAKDSMYECQKNVIKKNFSNTLISTFLSSIIPSGIESKIQDDIKSTKITLLTNKKTARWALWQMRDKYKVDSFFRFGKLIVQNPTKLKEPADVKTFRAGYNIIDDKLNSRMERPIKVVLYSYDPNTGQLNKGEYGSAKEEKVFTIDGISAKEIKKRAENIYMEIAGPGMTGSFVTFGYPSVQHSEIIRIEDLDEPERTKSVFVEKVVKTFDAVNATYRQEIFPGIIDFRKDANKKLPSKKLQKEVRRQ